LYYTLSTPQHITVSQGNPGRIGRHAQGSEKTEYQLEASQRAEAAMKAAAKAKGKAAEQWYDEAIVKHRPQFTVRPKLIAPRKRMLHHVNHTPAVLKFEECFDGDGDCEVDVNEFLWGTRDVLQIDTRSWSRYPLAIGIPSKLPINELKLPPNRLIRLMMAPLSAQACSAANTVHHDGWSGRFFIAIGCSHF
jgi:hypothetical protein